MTPEQSYEKYLVLSESNGTTNKLSTDRGKFKILFNLCQNRIIEWFIENNGSDENRYIQKIKVPYTKLNKRDVKDIYTSFDIPKDYFEYIDLFTTGSTEECKNIKLATREVKQDNVNILYNNPTTDPSIKYAETFHTLGQNTIQIYTKSFDISKCELSYYRYPVQIQLVDEDNPESQFVNTQLDFDDKLINRIILMAISYHSLSADDQKWQIFKQETIQKF